MKFKSKAHALYDVCECNHEFLQHNKKGCSATVPIGKEGYRGWFDPKVPFKTCYCKKFKYSLKNTNGVSPSEQ